MYCDIQVVYTTRVFPHDIPFTISPRTTCRDVHATRTLYHCRCHPWWCWWVRHTPNRSKKRRQLPWRKVMAPGCQKTWKRRTLFNGCWRRALLCAMGRRQTLNIRLKFAAKNDTIFRRKTTLGITENRWEFSTNLTANFNANLPSNLSQILIHFWGDIWGWKVGLCTQQG